MAVPAIELKPRGAVALFDSAIRLCARTGGVWAITLPGGAVLTWAVLQLAEAAQQAQSLAIPAAIVALAWILRGFCQAAACHYLDEQLVGASAPDVRRSFKAAFARAPTVVITAAYLPLFTLSTVTFTLGIGFFLLANHLAGWAAAMKGKGGPLALYGTSTRLLGPTRSSAPVIRLLFLSIVLFGLNLHIAVNALVYLGRTLAALDLTYVQRFVSLDNGAWVLVLVMLSFTAFEPLRAAVATLMLVDGRVRQEGLDLLAAVEQLPPRKTRSAAAMIVFALLFSAPARAEEAEPFARIQDAAAQCDFKDARLAQAPGELGGAEQEALVRLADEAEYLAWELEDCDALSDRLGGALPQLSDAVVVQSAPDATQLAKNILSRPEFAVAPPTEASVEEEDGLWARFEKWLKDFFEKLSKQRDARTGVTPPSGAGMGAARMVTVLLIAGAIAVVAVLLFLAFRRGQAQMASLEVVAEGSSVAAAAHGESALARPPEGWAHLADELAAKGEFRDAVRSLYLALLSKLHRVGAINYDPALSNWDYCREFRGHREWVPAFRDLTNRFDFAWYGQLPVTPEAYGEFRRLTEPMLSRGSTAHA